MQEGAKKKCTVGSFNWDGITPPNIRIIFRFSLVKISGQPSLTWGTSLNQPVKIVTNIKSSSSLKITVSLHGIMAKSPDLTFGDHNQVRTLSRYSYSDQHELNISIHNLKCILNNFEVLSTKLTYFLFLFSFFRTTPRHCGIEQLQSIKNSMYDILLEAKMKDIYIITLEIITFF